LTCPTRAGTSAPMGGFRCRDADARAR
jgi:hypothetical protein